VNRKGDLTHLSSVYYEYDMDSLPASQYRRGDMDVDHEYVYDLVPRLAVERIRDTEGGAGRMVPAPSALRSAWWLAAVRVSKCAGHAFRLGGVSPLHSHVEAKCERSASVSR